MTLRAYLVELVGTFLLVFISAATVCASYATAAHFSVGLVGIAVAQGCALAAILSFTVKVSEGCLNPAVTLALWVTRRFDGGRAIALICVQVIGAAFAGGLIVSVFDQDTLQKAYAGTPHLRSFIDSAGQATAGDWFLGSLTEAVLTFLLTLTLLNSVLIPERPGWVTFVPGMALCAAVLAGYHLTGAALNPARWFGTAVWQQTQPLLAPLPLFRDHLPYWMGPIVGALLAAVVHAEWIRRAEKKG
jgi:glycerol uptake facilitator-like aquaporin